MKKLIAILLSILTVLLIFASCDTGGEEKSSEPISEVSSVEVSSVEVSSQEEKSEISSETGFFTSEPYMKPITAVSDEELEIYENLKFLPLFCEYFTHPGAIEPNELYHFLCLFTGHKQMTLFQETYDDKVGSLRWGEIYSYPLGKAEKVLQTYFGEYPFAEKLKQATQYNSQTDTIDIDGYSLSLGGVSLSYPLPFIREGNQTTIYGLYSQSVGENDIQIVSGHKIVILEEDDRIQFKSFVPLTEDEIADLNEKYFGEA